MARVCLTLGIVGLSERSASDRVHVYCRPGNHKGQGANVLFADGSVGWVTAQDFATLSCDIAAHSRATRPTASP